MDTCTHMTHAHLQRLKFLDSDGNVDSGVVGPDTPAHSSEYVLVDSIASFQVRRTQIHTVRTHAHVTWT